MTAKCLLKLYILKQKADFQKAIETLKSILETELKGLYLLEVINVSENPQQAEEDRILATPTLVKVSPPPVRKIIGDFSDKEKVLAGLGLTTEKKEKVSPG
ncbi:MAG: circadian clock protein KaiB [Sedimentisphaerales bacterium]|nr:circadian clock protein KaiB [Sedimentisphaerales bacterium]